MRRLLRDVTGVTAVEFALVAPAFLMFMFLIIDGARMAWTYQTLQEVATHSARCAALGVTGCKTSAEVKLYARTRAANAQVALAESAVSLDANVMCSNIGGMTRVTISSSYQGATTKLLPSKLTTLDTESCFPTAPVS